MNHEELKQHPTNVLIGTYLRLRDMKKEQEDALKEALKPLNHSMEIINTILTERLLKDGADSFATPDGTAYKTERRSVKVEDWQATIEWLKEGQLWHMLDKRLNKIAVETYFEEHGELPPGVAITRELRVNIRTSPK